ncbi:MAG: hypothetical protein AW12_02823 [Candidatus Accumulibacter sp. BA-94]|nr:MAG: hypothetical protein AW12_02823 [Candidatus Accumulibacter sp. BA-94]
MPGEEGKRCVVGGDDQVEVLRAVVAPEVFGEATLVVGGRQPQDIHVLQENLGTRVARLEHRRDSLDLRVGPAEALVV